MISVGAAGLDEYPYVSRRMPVFATNGVVATSQPLAAQAGLQMLLLGGNAVDAAVAAAIALTVVEPTSNGIGSDAFALVWDGGRLYGLNGSGRAPASLSLDVCRNLGFQEIPPYGWPSVTVPGAPAAWHDLHSRFGRIAFEALFQPAIAYAAGGYPVGPVTAAGWRESLAVYREVDRPEIAAWLSTFAPNGNAPSAGTVVRLPEHAATLRGIADSNASDFYGGILADRITRFAAATGGFLTATDLAAHTSTWVEPIRTDYRGYDIWEIPPNGQGISALAALNILEGFDLGSWPRESDVCYHLQIEAMKLAFADAYRYVADVEHADVPTGGMLDKAYAAQRRTLIDDRAASPTPGNPPKGGTVYLCAADRDGQMVSYIQSNYMGFGSGIVVPGTGIALQNRGANFSLDSNHPNCLAPGKRPYHTIIPAFMSRGGEAIGPFGVMGGFMQPQGHVQMVVNQVDYGLNPQASLDAPRWRWLSDKYIEVEPAVPGHVVAGLRRRGHLVHVQEDTGPFGRGQIIRRLSEGASVAASEPRADGAAVGY